MAWFPPHGAVLSPYASLVAAPSGRTASLAAAVSGTLRKKITFFFLKAIILGFMQLEITHRVYLSSNGIHNFTLPVKKLIYIFIEVKVAYSE